MAKEKKKKPARPSKYEKRYTVNATFEDLVKIAVTPKEDLKKEDFNCKKP